MTCGKAGKANKIAYGYVISMLMSGEPCTAKEIASQSGFHRTTVQSILTVWHDMGLIHIVDFEKDKMGRDKAPMYQLGEGKDAQPTPGIGNTEKMRRWRAKKRQMKLNQMLVGDKNANSDVYPVRQQPASAGELPIPT